MRGPRNPAHVVWICSWQRSGSTWLAEILAGVPGTRYVYEPANVPDALFDGFDAAQVALPEHSPRHVRAVRGGLHGTIHSPWTDQFNTVTLARRAVVKDVRALGIAGDVAEAEPHVAIVMLLRHPFAVARSVVDLGWHTFGDDGQGAFEHEVSTWARLVRDALLDSRLDRAHWMSYEELQGNTEATLHRLHGYLVSTNATWLALDVATAQWDRASATDFRRTHAQNGGREASLPEAWITSGLLILQRYGLDVLYDQRPDPRITFDEARRRLRSAR